MTGVQLVSVCPALCLLITTNPCHHIGHRHHCHHCDHHHHRHHHHRLRAFFISDNDIYYIIHGIKSNYILSKKNCERYMTHPHVLCIVSCIDLEKALRSVTIDPALRSSWQVYHSSWRGVVTTPAFKTSPYSGRLVDFTEYIPPWIWGFTFWGWMKYPRQKLATRCVIDWMAILNTEWTQGIEFLGMCHWILNLKYHCYFEKYCSMPWETIRNVENVTVYENQLQNVHLHESCICLFLLYRSNPRKVTTGAL